MLTKDEVRDKIKKGESFEGNEIQEIDFEDYTFEVPVNFKAAIFRGSANFRNAKFLGDVDFQGAQFWGSATFESATFSQKVYFPDTKFQADVSFSKAILAEDVIFDSKGIEIEELDFFGHISKYPIYFKGAIFSGLSDFTGAKFQRNTNFQEVQFVKNGMFDLATFSQRAYFPRAKFQASVSFSKTIFGGKATFGNAEFHKKASFENARFLKETYFGYARFFDEAVFNYSRFLGTTFFDGEDKNRVFSGNHPTWMISVFFQKPEETLFRTVDLSKCSLINTDLSKVELTDVKWAVKRTLLDIRKVAYDEISSESKKMHSLIEKVYRQLKKNYEHRGSYGEAGDFYYGEMEMRRLSHRGIFKYVSFTAFYKYLSGYGEKYWRAFFWLLCFMVMFTASYLLVGLKLQTPELSSPATFVYKPSLNFKVFLDSQFWQDFFRSFFHALEVATFRNEKTFLVFSISGQFLEIIEMIVMPIQVALTILSVKRKFKR